jgi:hypothetical protein
VQILMVAPTAFMKNEAASLDNYFMKDAPAGLLPTATTAAAAAAAAAHAERMALQRKVLEEFSELHRYVHARA